MNSMNDLVVRQEVDDLISRRGALDCVTYDVEYTTERIKGLPTAQPEQRWTPVTERLPEENHWLGGSGK